MPPCMPLPTYFSGLPSSKMMPPAMYSPKKAPASPPITRVGHLSWYCFMWMPLRQPTLSRM